MSSLREFVKPDGKGGWKPDDKAWLYDQVLFCITTPNNRERFYEGKRSPRSERDIYSKLAPTSGNPFCNTRPSWGAKPRKVKRAMLAAVLKRLIDDGKIRIEETRSRNVKSQHGFEVRLRKTDSHMFGGQHDGLVKFYAETNTLQAIVDALEASE